MTRWGTASVGVLAFAAAYLLGCRPQQLGQVVSPTRADAVDASWVTAVRNCWPALRESTTSSIAASLLDPHAFRGAFPAFATLADKQVENIASHPVASAPAPDISVFRTSVGTLLTRAEATSADTKVPQQTAVEATSDTLCVVHTGSPVGFR